MYIVQRGRWVAFKPKVNEPQSVDNKNKQTSAFYWRNDHPAIFAIATPLYISEHTDYIIRCYNPIFLKIYLQ